MAKTAFKITHIINFVIKEDDKLINVNFNIAYNDDEKLKSIDELKVIMEEQNLNEIEASGYYTDTTGTYNIKAIKLENGEIKFIHNEQNNDRNVRSVRTRMVVNNSVSFNNEPDEINDTLNAPFVGANQFQLFTKIIKKCLFKKNEIIEKNSSFALKPNESCIVINLEDDEDTTLLINDENYDITDLVENNTSEEKTYSVNKKCSVLYLR